MQIPENLQVWHKSHQLTLDVYLATDSPSFPRRYPLINQIQSSVLSVESNIVEGATRGSKPEFLRFLRYALSSACELHTQLLVAKDLAYMPLEHFGRMDSLLDEVRKMLWSLMGTVEAAMKSEAASTK
jgi:four helix bundle protein